MCYSFVEMKEKNILDSILSHFRNECDFIMHPYNSRQHSNCLFYLQAGVTPWGGGQGATLNLPLKVAKKKSRIKWGRPSFHATKLLKFIINILCKGCYHDFSTKKAKPPGPPSLVCPPNNFSWCRPVCKHSFPHKLTTLCLFQPCLIQNTSDNVSVLKVKQLSKIYFNPM